MWDSLDSLVGYYCAFADGLICKYEYSTLHNVRLPQLLEFSYG